MKFAETREIKIGTDGVVILREPTNKEWNDFSSELITLRRHGKARDESVIARGKLFDRLVTRIDNCEDGQGPVTLETKDRFPIRLKSDIIFNAFQVSEVDIEEKN
jgi:hypothetical protein